MTTNSYNTLFIGKVCKDFPVLPSTNNYATDWLSKNKPSEGTVITTDNQTAGKGQIGSSWESEPHKNLSVSIILYPSFLTPRRQFELNQAVTLGVYDFIAANIEKNTWIKWPNDIYINNEKIAGILIQTSLMGHRFQYAVVGIGINVNQREFQFAPNPTSLYLETNKEFDLATIRQELFWYIEMRYLQLKRNNPTLLKRQYETVLYRHKQVSIFERLTNHERFKGEIKGVADNGQLIIEHNGGLELFGLKELKYI